MKVVAKVIAKEPVVSGTSTNGNDWEKQTVVVETLGLEAETLAVEFMGERKTRKTKALELGDQVDVVFSIKCREYMGKWFTRLDGQSIDVLKRVQNEPAQPTVEMPPEEGVEF
jgi:hypothetical protein